MEGVFLAPEATFADQELPDSRVNQTRPTESKAEQVLEPAAEASHERRASAEQSNSVQGRNRAQAEWAAGTGAGGAINDLADIEHDAKAQTSQLGLFGVNQEESHQFWGAVTKYE